MATISRKPARRRQKAAGLARAEVGVVLSGDLLL
jgi:hypothetical protein